MTEHSSLIAKRLDPNAPNMWDVLDLVKRNFHDMEGRIDPPSSVLGLTVEDIRAQAKAQEVWTLGDPPYACVFFSRKNDVLYIGRLAVDEERRNTGLARQLLDLAAERAQAMGLSALELATRVELTENHAAYERLGFSFYAHGTHDGYAQPTYLVLRRPV